MLHKVCRISLFVFPVLPIAFLLTLLVLITPNRSSASHGTPPANQDAPLGTNLMRVFSRSSDWPFVDAFKASMPWFTLRNNQIVTGTGPIDLDAHGWVRSLPAGNDAAFDTVATSVFSELDGHYPAGQYVVLYDGAGTLTYSGDVDRYERAPIAGRDVLTVTPGNAGIVLRITSTDPDGTGNYLRNIRLLIPGFEESYATQIFHPLFLEKLQPFKVLRFMDWMRTNDSMQREWADRPLVDDARYSTEAGVPLEIMIVLSNRLHADPWFPMPHMATDEYVTQFATLVRDTLVTEQAVYVEYSNEVWNGAFGQRAWVTQQAEAEVEWLPSPASANTKRNNWFGKRTAEICDIWKSVWGEQSERVICVMSAQANHSPTATEALTCTLWTEGRPCAGHQIDAIAIAPYFGGYLGDPLYASDVTSWTQAADGGLANLFAELTAGGVLSGTQGNGALPRAYNQIATYVHLAQLYNLPLITYEGGQHLVGVMGVQNNAAITQLFTSANRDERMGDLYAQYLTQWKALGGQLFMHHTNTRRYNHTGSFGALEYADQDTSPKYAALTQFIQQNPCWWPGCAGTAAPTPTPTPTLIPTAPAAPTTASYLPVVASP